MATFTPQAQITNQLDLGSHLLRQAATGARSTSSIAPLASLLLEISGGLNRSAGLGALQQNQQIQTDAMRSMGEVLARGDFGGASNVALQSGVPDLANLGVTLAGKTADKPTAAMRNAKAAGLTPGTPEYTEFLRGSSGGVTVNLPGQEKAFGKKYGGKLADRMIKLEDQAAGANQMLGQYETISTLLNDPNVYTGTGAEFVQWVKKTGESLFGLEIEGVGEGEAASKFRNLAVGKVREMLGDTRMSDADRRVYQETIPGLSDTKEGIILTTELMRQAANRAKTSEAKAFELMMADPAPGQMNATKWARFRRWERNTPIFNAETVRKAQGLAKQKGKRTPPSAGSKKALDELFDLYKGLER